MAQLTLQETLNAVASELDGKVADAPQDGNAYARRNGAWQSFTLEMPYTAYNNSEQPSDVWARLAGVSIAVDRSRFWNEYLMQFDFAMRTRGMDLDSDNTKIECMALGKGTCHIYNDRIDGRFQLSYCDTSEPNALNLYCGLRKSEFSQNTWAWDLWLHNRKNSAADSNSTFVKITNIQIIGTEIEQYNQIQVDYFSQQQTQGGNPASEYDIFQLIQN